MAEQLSQDLKKIDELVKKIESPKITLEEAIDRYEEAVRLTNRAKATLQSMEMRVEIINADGTIEPFEPTREGLTDGSQRQK